MTQTMRNTVGVLTMLAMIAAIAGCGISDPYTHPQATASPHPASPAAGPAAAQSPGEPSTPPPPSAESQARSTVAATPEQAIRQFAVPYVNWTWRTLAPHLRELAAISVGAARLAEQQAAAAEGRDSEIATTHVDNRGQIISIAPSQTQSGEWVVVTREQTGGNAQYDGLQASWHVTLAQLVHLPAGYAISQWLPQN
jgi:predicted small lipoprotein YifL